MKRLTFLGIFGVFCFFTLTILAQTVPNLLNYQGRLTDAAGNPITTATTVKFSLYQGGDATTPGSGTLVYEEDATVTPDDNGVFDHTIGSGSVVYGTLDATVFQSKYPVYLEITIDPAGVSDTLLPRKQVVTVGYSFISELAYDADRVDGKHASAFALVGHHHDADYVNEGQANSVTSSMIVDGTIMNADINAAANIAGSKIDPTGLDADLLDGKDSLDFVHTAGDDMTGTLQVNTSTQFALSANSSRAQFGMQPATIAVEGVATGSSGYTYGVYGQSASTSGTGVKGYATASSGTTYGVSGITSSTQGRGVYGYASTTSGTNYGVYGWSKSTSGRGVYGTAPTYGVYGHATDTSGINYGIWGQSDSTVGRGVNGEAPYMGVRGVATASSGYNYGVYGGTSSSSGYGVFGVAPTYGVYGHATASSGRGVYGYASASSGRGVYGEAPYMGVFGYASASSGLNYGVYGRTNSSGGFAGFFDGRVKVNGTTDVIGNVDVDGNMTVSGTFWALVKLCVQEIEGGKKVGLYVMESPENWFEDFGSGQMVNGRAVVQLERVFAQTVNTGIDYYVFLTPSGNCQGLYISRKDKDSFEVRELGGGTSTITFDYRIVAKRRGYEDVRLEEFTEPEESPEEPMLPIETKEAKVKQPRNP